MNDKGIIHYEHSELDFQSCEVLYTLNYEKKEYWIVGVMGPENDEYLWNVQIQKTKNDEELDILEDAELANKILIRFFEIMEEACIADLEAENGNGRTTT